MLSIFYYALSYHRSKFPKIAMKLKFSEILVASRGRFGQTSQDLSETR